MHPITLFLYRFVFLKEGLISHLHHFGTLVTCRSGARGAFHRCHPPGNGDAAADVRAHRQRQCQELGQVLGGRADIAAATLRAVALSSSLQKCQFRTCTILGLRRSADRAQERHFTDATHLKWHCGGRCPSASPAPMSGTLPSVRW